jgi:hypothetical protein
MSLFDLSGHWSAPWRRTHEVVQVDLQAGLDVLTLDPDDYPNVDVVLAAPPCTHFTVANNRNWARCDADGRTALSIQLVQKTIDLVAHWDPRVWALENPKTTRLTTGTSNPRFTRSWGPDVQADAAFMTACLAVAPVQFVFHPYEFAGWVAETDEAYHKGTRIWGDFTRPTPRPVAPTDMQRGQSRISRLPGTAKNKRSATPRGFAEAFYDANRSHS